MSFIKNFVENLSPKSYTMIKEKSREIFFDSIVVICGDETQDLLKKRTRSLLTISPRIHEIRLKKDEEYTVEFTIFCNSKIQGLTVQEKIESVTTTTVTKLVNSVSLKLEILWCY